MEFGPINIPPVEQACLHLNLCTNVTWTCIIAIHFALGIIIHYYGLYAKHWEFAFHYQFKKQHYLIYLQLSISILQACLSKG